MKNKTMYIVTVIWEGKSLKPVIRMSEKAVSAYANRMYSKYCAKYGDYRADRGLTVNYGYFNDNMDWINVGDYHA